MSSLNKDQTYRIICFESFSSIHPHYQDAQGNLSYLHTSERERERASHNIFFSPNDEYKSDTTPAYI